MAGTGTRYKAVDEIGMESSPRRIQSSEDRHKSQNHRNNYNNYNYIV